MFAGKTTELLREVDRAEIAGIQTVVFKPIIDDRWGSVHSVRAHTGHEHEAIPVASSNDILPLVNENIGLVAIEEAQFFDMGVLAVIEEMLSRDIRVVAAGLPLDFRGEPFGPMPYILAYADEITRLTAICTYSDNGNICGEDATRTQRLVNGTPAHYTDPIILVGAEESYAPRCPSHHIVPGHPRRR